MAIVGSSDRRGRGRFAVSIRLPRFGAIVGTVLDENDVGMPEHEVVAYLNMRPPQIVTRAKTDDRGMFRLYGLDPGSYLVRSVWKQYEEGGYLPTFAKETDLVDQAYPFEVNFDQQVDRADVRPMPGRLYTLSVEVITIPPNPIEPLPVTLTLASEMGRETVQASNHRFGPLPAGQYEIFAQAPLERRAGIQGEYRRITLGGDFGIKMVLYQVPALQFTFEGAPDANSIQVLARRKDLAGEGPQQALKLTTNRVQLAAGPWELAVASNPGFYASAFSGPRYQRPADARADGWNEIFAGAGGPAVRFALSTSPGAVYGTVKSGSEPVAGAPVFLEPFDLEPSRRVTDPFVTVTDMHGQYRFTGLAPGVYRALSSFEFQRPDSAAMTNADAKPVRVQQGHDSQQDLELYGNR